MSAAEAGRAGRRRAWDVAFAVMLASLLGTILIAHGWKHYDPPPQPDAAQALGAPIHVPSRPVEPPVNPLPPAVPTQVRIPAIHVEAPLTGLGLLKNGHLAAPPDGNRNLAGWYRNGTSPGAVGTAVIAGHVDTTQGPAVFYNLGALKKGNTVEVDRADHTTAVFTIDAVEAYVAQKFPNARVYGAAARPELRLITCGAGFDRTHQQYLGNVVVYAHLSAWKRS